SSRRLWHGSGRGMPRASPRRPDGARRRLPQSQLHARDGYRMSSEILSQNDIDLLLGGGGLPGAAERGPAEREVQLYDFRRPHRVSKDRLRTLEAMYERFAKSVEGWIMGRVRDQVEITLQSVEQLSFGDFAL